MSAVRLPAVVLSAVVLAFAAAGCGGGDDGGNGGNSPPAQVDVWMASVCGALANWGKSLQAGVQDLRSATRDSKNLTTYKARFVTSLEDAEESSGEMVEKVKEAGPPNLAQGEAIQDDLVSTLEKIPESFSRAADRAKDLPTSDRQSFANGVRPLSEDLEESLVTVSSEFNSLSDRYQSPEIDDAKDGEPACQQFLSGG
jgi:hypothetical protein